MLAEVPVREQQGVVQVGALGVLRLQSGQLLDLDRLGVTPERDELQRVATEPRADERVQGERRALHRHPPPVHRHRERGVDEQRHARLRAVLGLLHLDVADLQAHTVAGHRRGRAALAHGALDRVGDRAGDVPRLGVAVGPLAGRAGAFTGGAGTTCLALAMASRHRLGDVAEQRLAQLAHRLRREPELSVGAALHGSRLAQSSFQVLEGRQVDDALVAQLSRQGVEIDVVEVRPAVRLRELLGQRIEIGQVLEHAGPVTEPDALLTVHRGGATPVLAGTQRLQARIEPAERVVQLRRPERLRRELRQLVTLLGRHRAHHALGRRRPLRHLVEQLVQVLRKRAVLGPEVVAVLVHEGVEVGWRVGAVAPLVEQVVEVVEHLVDGVAVGFRGVLERVLHAGEALVEQLAPQQVLDALVVLARLRALPLVGRELTHRGSRRTRQRIELQLGECALAVVEIDVARELAALGQHGPVEQLLDLGQGAVELVPLHQVAALLGDAAREVVEASLVGAAASEELAQGALGRVPRHDVLTDRVERLAEVDRRRERVGSAGVPAVPRRAGQASVLASHRSTPTLSRTPSRRRLSPWRCGEPGTGPRAPARSRWPAPRRRRPRRDQPPGRRGRTRPARGARPGSPAR